MPTIEHTRDLRSAFLKIGWAPVIAYGGGILLYFISFLIARHDYTNANTLLGVGKAMTVGMALLFFAGYLMTWLGMKQARRSFGITRAGDAFATLKILFLIFTILGAVALIISVILTGDPGVYTGYAAVNARQMASFGILIVALYLITVVYTIIALLIIRTQMKTIADTTNIECLEGAYAGARVIIYFLCTGIVTLLLTGLFYDKGGAAKYAIFALDFISLFLLLYAMVKWVKGWLGAATEVVRHEVEAVDYSSDKTVVSHEVEAVEYTNDNNSANE